MIQATHAVTTSTSHAEQNLPPLLETAKKGNRESSGHSSTASGLKSDGVSNHRGGGGAELYVTIMDNPLRHHYH